MKQTHRLFSGEIELQTPAHPLVIAEFLVRGGVFSKANRHDSFKRLAGVPLGVPYSEAALLPVTRQVFHDANGSGHVCGGRCLSAKGTSCECACGGLNHGAGVK